MKWGKSSHRDSGNWYRAIEHNHASSNTLIVINICAIWKTHLTVKYAYAQNSIVNWEEYVKHFVCTSSIPYVYLCEWKGTRKKRRQKKGKHDKIHNKFCFATVDDACSVFSILWILRRHNNLPRNTFAFCRFVLKISRCVCVWMVPLNTKGDTIYA